MEEVREGKLKENIGVPEIKKTVWCQCLYGRKPVIRTEPPTRSAPNTLKKLRGFLGFVGALLTWNQR